MAEREALATRGVGSTVDLAGTSGGRELSRGLVGVRVVARELNHPSAAGWNHYMRTETRCGITIYKKCIPSSGCIILRWARSAMQTLYYDEQLRSAMQNVLGRRPHEACWAEVPHEAQSKECRAKPSISDRGCLWRMYMDCDNAGLCPEIVRDFVAVVVMSSAGACTHVARYRCVLTYGQRISLSLLLVLSDYAPSGPKTHLNAFCYIGVRQTNH